MRLVNWRALVAGAAGIALAACGDDVTVVTPPPTITLNPAAINCTTGQTTAVGVSVSGGGAGTPTVNIVSSGAAAVVSNATTSGATVTCGNTPGSAVLTVTVNQNGQTVTGSVPVTVTQAPSPITAVSVSPSTATVAVGATVTLTPSVVAQAGANTAVRFSSAQPAIATVDSVSGVVRGVAPGIATIIVRSVANANVQAAATITVVEASAFVQSLTAQPSTVALQTGSTQQIAANVTLAPGAPAGTSRNVRYTSSDTSVVTVSSTGLITARRNGTAVITVASEAAPGVTQAVAVTVRDPAPVRLTIQSVRVVNAAGNLVPADLNNVTGNLFVTLNLDPGDFRPDSVRLRLGTAATTCQRFSAELAEAYRLSFLNGSADVQTIECQLNTAQFNDTTGAARVLNGQQNLQAEVFYRPQGAAAGTQTQQAAISQALTINNASGFFVNVTNTPTAEQAAVDADGIATGPQGVTWRAGTINVTVLPVNFTPVQSPGTGQTFTITLQDANGIVAQRTATQNANAATFTASFPGASANAWDQAPAPSSTDRTLNGYTSPNAGVAPAFNPQGQFTGGGTLVVVGTQAGTGNTIILNASGAPAGIGGQFGNAVATPVFIDNQNPQPAVNFGNNGGTLGPPTSNFSATGTTFVGFINNAFNFQNALTPQFLTGPTNPASGLTATNPDFGGVDRVSVQFFAGSSTSATTLTGGTAITTGANLSPSTTNTANNLAVLLVDALGNRRAQIAQTGAGGVNLAINATGTTVSGGQSIQFGVDISAPTIAQTAGPNANQVFNATNGGQNTVTLQFAGSDETGFGTNPILITATRTARTTTGNGGDVASNDPTGTSLRTFCATGIDGTGNLQFATDAAATSGGPVTTCTPFAVAGSVSIPAALNGQYTITAQARDQAGNVSSQISRILVVDTKLPVIGGIGLPQTLSGNVAAQFPTSASDNLELGSVRGEVDYGTALALQYPEASLGSAFDNVFTNTSTGINIVIPSFIRSITLAPNAQTSTVRTPASNFRGVVFDVANNLAFSNLPIPLANLGNLSATSPFVTANNPVTSLNAFSISVTPVAANAVAGQTAQISGGSTTGQPTSATITVVQTGAQNVFISPLQRIELYVQVQGLAGAPPTFRFVGTVPSGLVTDNANNNGARQITSSFTINAGTSPLITAPSTGTASYTIIAVGVNSNGDAIVSDPITLTIVP